MTPARGGGLALPALAHPRLPPLAYRVVDLCGHVGAGVLAGAAPVAVDGVGGNPDLLGHGLRAAELPDQVADLTLERLRRLSSERLPAGPLVVPADKNTLVLK